MKTWYMTRREFWGSVRNYPQIFALLLDMIVFLVTASPNAFGLSCVAPFSLPLNTPLLAAVTLGRIVRPIYLFYLSKTLRTCAVILVKCSRAVIDVLALLASNIIIFALFCVSLYSPPMLRIVGGVSPNATFAPDSTMGNLLLEGERWGREGRRVVIFMISVQKIICPSYERAYSGDSDVDAAPSLLFSPPQCEEIVPASI
jgi:hypothetical protein